MQRAEMFLQFPTLFPCCSLSLENMFVCFFLTLLDFFPPADLYYIKISD